MSATDVGRIVDRDFPPAEAGRVHELLADADLGPRVLLAVLKLAAGDADAVERCLATARGDPRDVLAYAEYPGYMAATTPMTDLDPARRRAISRADAEQYEAWLRR